MTKTHQPTTIQERCRLFTSLLDRASRLSHLSRKQLAHQLSLSVGTINAYLLHRVDPLNTRLVIQQRLAALNGLELNEVMALYETGDWDALPRRQPRLLRHVQKPLRSSRLLPSCSDHLAEWTASSCLPSRQGKPQVLPQLVSA